MAFWLTYMGLAFVTILYAYLLENYKHHLEPNWTWVEVVIGNTICLTAAGIYVRSATPEPTWHDYERSIALAFVVGGSVIIAWQLLRMRRRIERHQRETIDIVNGDHEEASGFVNGGDEGNEHAKATAVTPQALADPRRGVSDRGVTKRQPLSEGRPEGEGAGESDHPAEVPPR